MDKREVQALVDSIAHWYHRISLTHGIVTPGVNDTQGCLALLDLPTNLSGMRVLDIGARDGFYSFECERRGADVVAIDYMSPEQTGFPVARKILNARVDLTQENLYRLRPETWGTFDLVLCLGVLYHLRDPLWALDILRSLTRRRLILETHVIDEAVLLPDGTKRALEEVAPQLSHVPLLQFYPRNSLNNDYTNYWGANMCGVAAILAEANFRVTRQVINGERGIFDCTVADDTEMSYFCNIARLPVRT